MNKKKLILLGVIIILLISIIYFVNNYNSNNSNNSNSDNYGGYKTLCEIANVKEGKLHLKDEEEYSYYRFKPLTYVYAKEEGKTAHFPMKMDTSTFIYCDTLGIERLELEFAEERPYLNEVIINGEMYCYKEIGKDDFIYENYPKTKKPSKEKSEIESLMADLASIFDEYGYDYKFENSVDFYRDPHPQNYSNAVSLEAAGTIIRIIEYNDDLIEDDYELLCNTTLNAREDEKYEVGDKIISKYTSNNTDFIKFTIIKQGNIIYSIEYDSTEMPAPRFRDECREIINNFFKEKNILQ